MIRQPSTHMQLLAWHTAALAGQEPDRHDGLPHAGWYKTQLVKKGPWVPVRIWCDRDIDPDTGELTRDEVLRIEVDGIDEGDPADHWTHLRPISREEYAQLQDYKLRSPAMADTKRSIDLASIPTPPSI